MKMIKSLWLAMLITLVLCLRVFAQLQPASSMFGTTGKPGRVREPSPKTMLDDFFPRTDIPQVSLPPISLKATIPGIPANAMEKLSNNYFVVVNDARTTDFAEIYRQNRIDGKPNFVTVDCIIHPLLAHRNAIKTSVITKTCSPALLALLEAMIDQSASDYHETEDPEVKDDIIRNLAYLSVAVHLLDPSAKLKEFGGAQDLIDEEMHNIEKQDLEPSAIFKRIENFALYRPFGFYQSSDPLKNFFRCRQWLARMYFSMSDITNNTESGNGNEFRRAVLLNLSLHRCQVAGTNGLGLWRKLQKTLEVIENNDARLNVGDLSPENFATVIGAHDTNLKATIEALSQPLTRTRLLLSVKSAETKDLSSTSIFELNAKNKTAAKNCIFRLLQTFDPPEFAWLAAQIVQEKDATTGFNNMPAGLLFMHARGSHLANNILADNTWQLDEDLVSSLPALDKDGSIANQFPSPQSLWPTLLSYLKPLPESAQNSLRTNAWMTRGLEAALASWLDNWIASDRPPPTSDPDEAQHSKAPPTVRKMSRFNYLEPEPEVFRKLANGLRQYDSSLKELGLLPSALSTRSDDFTRLLDRLAQIAKQELANQPLSQDDSQLLGNIDKVLEQIATPSAGSLYLSYAKLPKNVKLEARPAPASSEHQTAKQGQSKEAARPLAPSRFSGTNLGLGGPATLWIILRGTNGPVLCRGAVYSYYETQGDPITQAHWQRRLDYGLLKPPFWCDSFQLVDQTSTKH